MAGGRPVSVKAPTVGSGVCRGAEQSPPGGDRRPPSSPELGPAASRAPPGCGGSWQPRWVFEGGCTAAGRGSPLPNALLAGWVRARLGSCSPRCLRGSCPVSAPCPASGKGFVCRWSGTEVLPKTSLVLPCQKKKIKNCFSGERA